MLASFPADNNITTISISSDNPWYVVISFLLLLYLISILKGGLAKNMMELDAVGMLKGR